jgi:hypothetical protein
MAEGGIFGGIENAEPIDFETQKTLWHQKLTEAKNSIREQSVHVKARAVGWCWLVLSSS